MKATFVRYSICDCGFPILGDGIPLGAIYDVNPARKERFKFICGGCGKVQRITGIWVESKGGRKAGYLPEQIFELEKPQQTEGTK